MITHSRLLELLKYDPETGEFRWRKGRGKVKAGALAGTRLGPNYRQIMIDFVPYSGHVLAWFYVNGEWPVNQIDHKDHALGDIFTNLREATPTQNRHNTAPKVGGHSKWKGVTYDAGRKKCWKMAFKFPDGRKLQKRFEDELEAAEEYIFLALEHHGDFVRLE